jgi:hypothetical protein
VPTPRLLIAEALALTLLARAATALLPFPLLLRLVVRVSGAPDAGSRDIAHICYAVSRIAHWPVRWAVCLPQALAAHWMLARRAIPSQIQFGVRSRCGELSSHAWLVCDGRHVLGHRAGLTYQPVFAFPPQKAV